MGGGGGGGELPSAYCTVINNKQHAMIVLYYNHVYTCNQCSDDHNHSDFCLLYKSNQLYESTTITAVVGIRVAERKLAAPPTDMSCAYEAPPPRNNESRSSNIR